MSAIAETSPVVQGEVPGVLNASALMDERPAMDRGPKTAKDEQSPGIARLRGPAAEQRPGDLPEQQAQSIAAAPGAGVAAGLAMGMQIGHRLGKRRHLDLVREATQKLSSDCGRVVAHTHGQSGLAQGRALVRGGG